MRSVLRWGIWALGLATIALVLARVGLGDVRATLSRVGPRFLWTVAAYAAATAVGALPWGLLIPREERPSWRAVVTSRFAASGVNALLPFFSIGDAGRLLWMRRPAWSSGTAAIVVDRLLFLLAGAALLIAGVASSRSMSGLPASFAVVGGAVALAMVIGTAVFSVVVRRGRLMARARSLIAWLRGRARPAATAPGATSGSWDALTSELLAGSKRRLAAGLGLHVVSRALFAFEIYAGLRALGLPAGWRETTIFAAVPVALSVIGTFIPGQLGVQEATQALVAASLGIGPSAGLALALLQRARQLVFVPLSGLLVALVSGRSRASDP